MSVLLLTLFQRYVILIALIELIEWNVTWTGWVEEGAGELIKIDAAKR